ncbi:MAG: DUF1772 domain-containing protein [Acidobacteriaceae bacterium]
MNLLSIATTLCIGPLIGTEFAVSAFVNPVLWKLDAPAQAAAIRLFARRLGAAMPFWYVASLLLLLAVTLGHLHRPGVLLLGAASAIWAAVIVLTLLFLVPINNRMAKLDAAAFTEAARRQHRRWDRLHRLRVAALAVAMAAFLAGIRP